LTHSPSDPYNVRPSLHDALPISSSSADMQAFSMTALGLTIGHGVTHQRTIQKSYTSYEPRMRYMSSRSPPHSSRTAMTSTCDYRSEEHTSELQSRFDLVCRLLLE